MASGGPVRELSEELSCPICLEYFRDPVILTECGHNFCRGCLNRTWGEPILEEKASCPKCRGIVQPMSHLKPNRQLANVVEIAKRLQREEEEARGRVCEKHREPLKLFCREDRVPICVVCDRSKEHRKHDVIPMEEAAAEAKDKLHGYIEYLRKEREKILVHKADREKQTQGLLQQTESEMQTSVAEFSKMHQFLVGQEQLLRIQMEEAKTKIARERDEHLAILSKYLASLEYHIQKVEEKIQQPATELLQVRQDVEGTLKRCKKRKKFWNPVAFSAELTHRIQDNSVINSFVTAEMKKFKGTLASKTQLQKECGEDKMED